jgi:methylmalonyl-CoA mutase, C-terminal domain
MDLEQPRPIKVLIAKTSLDGHIRGIIVVSRALRDEGMEVIYGGMLTPKEIILTAIEEDVDVIGLNIGGRYGTVRRILDMIKEKQLDNILLIAGGPIPQEDVPLLKEWGITGVFPPGSSMASIAQCIRENIKRI